MSEKIEDLWGLTDEERLLCAQARAEGRADALREAARITRRERDDFVEARAQGLPLLRAEAILGPLADHLDQLAASAQALASRPAADLRRGCRRPTSPPGDS